MRVIAVDVGLRITGYVISDVEGLKITLVKEDEIKTSSLKTFSKKLYFVFSCIEAEIEKFRPEAILLEKLYSHYRHPTTLGILAQLRGTIVLLAEQKQLPIFEFSTTKARKSLVGKGNCDSGQVKKMAENLTGHSFKSTHTADAFSLVVAFSHMQKFDQFRFSR